MTVRKFRPRREITLTQLALSQFIGLSFLGRLRWLFFGWKTFTEARNRTLRQALQAEKLQRANEAQVQ